MDNPGDIATKDLYREHPTRPGARVLVARKGTKIPSNVVRIIDAPAPTHKAIAGPGNPAVVQADGDDQHGDAKTVDYSALTVAQLNEIVAERTEAGSHIDLPADARKQQIVDALTYDDESRGV